MKTQHTPGPWYYAYGSIWIEARNGQTEEISIGGADRSEPRTQPTERDANCRLMAAAPELLEALQAVSRLDYLNEHNALAAQVKAAIAKATKQTP